MPKWLLFGLAAIGNFIIAASTYQGGRIVIPVILVAAGLCFVFAAAGAARSGASGRA